MAVAVAVLLFVAVALPQFLWLIESSLGSLYTPISCHFDFGFMSLLFAQSRGAKPRKATRISKQT